MKYSIVLQALNERYLHLLSSEGRLAEIHMGDIWTDLGEPDYESFEKHMTHLAAMGKLRVLWRLEHICGGVLGEDWNRDEAALEAQEVSDCMECSRRIDDDDISTTVVFFLKVSRHV
jgi:hypothetical protein